jgi:release factor glutamine methyltransferase
VDNAPAALRVAAENAQAHDVRSRMDLICGHLTAPLGAGVDLVCANLPYIPTDQLRRLEVGMREPTRALDGGPDGLALVVELLRDLPRLLNPGACALLEVGSQEAGAALGLAREQVPRARVTLLKDLAGRHRVLEVRLPDA